MLPTGIKTSPDEILQTTPSKCVSTQCERMNAAVSQLDLTEFCDCQKCDYQSRMHMVDNEIEDENNDSESGIGDEQFVRYDIIICCINLI